MIPFEELIPSNYKFYNERIILEATGSSATCVSLNSLNSSKFMVD